MSAQCREMFTRFKYFRLRGINLKLWSRAGPQWGFQGEEDATCHVNEWAYFLPRTIYDTMKMSDAVGHQIPADLPPADFNKFVQLPSVTRRLTYWNKPIRLYQKWPLYGYGNSYLNDTSNENRYMWHETAVALKEVPAPNSLKFTITFYGPTVSFAEALTNDDLKIETTFYLEFKDLAFDTAT